MRASTPVTPREPRNGVLTLTGYGLRLAVERGHLLVDDGAGAERHSSRFPRVNSGIDRVIVLGHSGSVTLEALRWLHEIGAAFVQIGADGDVIATGAPHALTDVRLRRNQAAAMGTTEGLAIARDLLMAKVAGQAEVIDRLDGHREVRGALAAALDEMQSAQTLDRLRFVESRAAAMYWRAWEHIPVRFAGREAKHVPLHWRTFGTRSSVLSASPRKATSPANALLNYLYAIVEAESRLAALAVGCDPALGVIHTDQSSRDSLACDLMEPVRPQVDGTVLRLLSTHTFERSDFFETREGNCRLMPEISRPLAASALDWSRAIAPIAERVGGAFRHGSAATFLPSARYDTNSKRYRTPLTGANRSRGAKGRTVLPGVVTSLASRCRSCGAPLGKRRVTYCDACRPGAVKAGSAKGVKVQRELRALGLDRRSSGATRAKHRQHATLRAQERRAWESTQDVISSRATYEREIVPLLRLVPSEVLAAATGLTSAFVAKAKRGEATPHARHWEALRAAATAYVDANRTAVAIRDDPTFFEREIEPYLRSLGRAGIQAATGLSKSYSRRVLAGHHVPDAKHWPALYEVIQRNPVTTAGRS